MDQLPYRPIARRFFIMPLSVNIYSRAAAGAAIQCRVRAASLAPKRIILQMSGRRASECEMKTKRKE